MQNAFLYRNNGIRQYPSSSSRKQAQPAEYNKNREAPSYDSENGKYEARINAIENRLKNLESLESQIKDRMNNIQSQTAISDGYSQRLARLEEQMQALRDVLVELRNYLAGKK
jgi:chromosome segregation ATPase